jgi:hypothetical protein
VAADIRAVLSNFISFFLLVTVLVTDCCERDFFPEWRFELAPCALSSAKARATLLLLEPSPYPPTEIALSIFLNLLFRQ